MTSAEELITIGRQCYREGRFAEAECAFDHARYRVVHLVRDTERALQLKSLPAS